MCVHSRDLSIRWVWTCSVRVATNLLSRKAAYTAWSFGHLQWDHLRRTHSNAPANQTIHRESSTIRTPSPPCVKRTRDQHRPARANRRSAFKSAVDTSSAQSSAKPPSARPRDTGRALDSGSRPLSPRRWCGGNGRCSAAAAKDDGVRHSGRTTGLSARGHVGVLWACGKGRAASHGEPIVDASNLRGRPASCCCRNQNTHGVPLRGRRVRGSHRVRAPACDGCW